MAKHSIQQATSYVVEDDVPIPEKFDTTNTVYQELLSLKVNGHYTFSLGELKTVTNCLGKIKRETSQRYTFRLVYKFPPTGRVFRVQDNTKFKTFTSNKQQFKPITV